LSFRIPDGGAPTFKNKSPVANLGVKHVGVFDRSVVAVAGVESGFVNFSQCQWL
jgi:hypothetical protein